MPLCLVMTHNRVTVGSRIASASSVARRRQISPLWTTSTLMVSIALYL